ncbi:MAG: secretin N-terminal domain-containing protein [Paracoccaceae bacterium]|nr:secretin N-terminal domain-containing protein [Paracoccaceae bacterium]
MNYFRLISFGIFAFSASFSSAASIQLLNATLEEAAAYFSNLTGNSYIIDFETDKRFVVTRDDLDTPDEFHQLFVELVTNAEAQIEKKAERSFVISTTAIEIETEEETKAPPKLIFRMHLENRMTFKGLQNLLATMSDLNGIKIIEEKSDTNSVILLGDNDSINLLKILLSSLPSEPVKKKTPKAVAETQVKPEIKAEKKSDEVIRVVDLNYGDANELMLNLQQVLGGGEDSVGLNIAAHVSANQLILSGKEMDVLSTISVIKQLDRAPRQVYVDAIIAEVSEESAKKLGLQFSVNSDNISASVVTGVSGVNIGSAAGNTFLAGAAGGIFAAGAGANVVPDIGLLLSALEGDNDNRILATPSLMTTENKESTILVGQNVPFITGQYTNQNGDNSAPFQTIKREDLGTLLKLKPKIGPNGNIVMEIWQEVSRIDQSTAGLSDVVTVKRQISTVISAMEGETIAIGGLRVEQQELATSKIPFFGDLPIIGKAFTQEVANTVSRNLAIFLRPTLVSNENQRKSVFNMWQKSLGAELTESGSDKSQFFKFDPVSTMQPDNHLTKGYQGTSVND